MSWLRPLCIAIASSMTMGCASITPLPQACAWTLPPSLLESCPKTLPALKSGASMGDLLTAVVEAYGQYHDCRIGRDALISAYRQYVEVCKPEKTK